MIPEVVSLGTGDHAIVVLEIPLSQGRFSLAGLLERNQRMWGREVMGVPVLGGDNLLPELKEKDVSRFFVGLGGVGDLTPKIALYQTTLDAGLSPIRAVHSRAVVSRTAALGPEITIMTGALINPGAQLGQNVIVNTGAIVEHDCIVGDHVHIATGAALSGGVRVGRGAHVGARAVVRQGLWPWAGAP